MSTSASAQQQQHQGGNGGVESLPEWQALQAHASDMKSIQMKNLFERDGSRFQTFSLQFDSPSSSSSSSSSESKNSNTDSGLPLLLDYSKNVITSETMDLLLQLVRACGVETLRDRMFAGDIINNTEQRAVLHVALRNRSHAEIKVNGENVVPMVSKVLTRMKQFSEQVRTGDWVGYTGKPIRSIVNIGIGGSDLGPVMAAHALKPYMQGNLALHFVSNVDGTHVAEVLKLCDPETTLFVIVSKTFTTQETLANACTARDWFLKVVNNNNSSQQQQQHTSKHFVAVSCNTQGARQFGIDPTYVFEMWDWVGGRYSLYSAVGLSLCIGIGYEHFQALLEGAHAMDEHFRTTKLEENLPVILAVLGVWYNNFMNAASHAILPYEQYLSRFAAHFQQVDMESNGKRVTRNGTPVNVETGPIIWGEPGTNGQHAFYQLLHQGTKLVPVDFLAGVQSHNPVSNNDHHRMLLSNFFAQSEALMIGKTAEQVLQELKDDDMPTERKELLISHKTFTGNRPSNSIMYQKLTPYLLGVLLSLYEMKVFVQGAIWGVNSFDQWGVELGKQLAKQILPELDLSQSQPVNNNHDSSTQGLIQFYRKHAAKL